MVIKKKNNVTLEIGNFDRTRRGFIITDHTTEDVVALPIETNYKRVKELFCLVNSNSIANGVLR